MAILLGEQKYISPGSLAANNDTTPLYVPGSVIIDAMGNKYVYVLAGANQVAGNAVTIDLTTATNAGTNVLATGNIYTVIEPTTATLTNFFGIMLGTVTSGRYGWCQVAGYNQVALITATLTAGKFSVVANTSYALADGTSTQGTAPQYSFFAMPTTSASGVPAIGTVLIYGMGAVVAF